MALNTREIAEFANVLAQKAGASDALTGLLLMALINSLIDGGTLEPKQVEELFRSVHKKLNENAPEGIEGTPAHQFMRDTLAEIAAEFGVKLPAAPPA